MNQRFLIILKYLVSISLLTWLIMRTDLSSMLALIVEADHVSLLPALLAYIASVFVVAYRWGLLLRARRLPIPLSRAASLYFIGNFFNNFLPTSIGGDAVRAYSASGDLNNRADAFASVFIERFVGLFAIVTMALAGLLAIALQFEQPYIVPATVVLFALMLAAFPVMFSRWWVERFKRVFERVTVFDIGYRAARLHEILYQYGAARYTLLANFGLSVLYQGLIAVMNVFIARSLGLPIPPLYFLVFVPIIATVSMFPFSINALGIREGGYVLLFAQIGRPAVEALALSLTVYGLTVLCSLPGGVLFAVQGRSRPVAVDQNASPISVLTRDPS